MQDDSYARIDKMWETKARESKEMRRETNTKFIVRIMDQASTGPLMQAFVLEALRNYSADILATETPPDAETGFISWNAWRACAAEADQALADRRT
jgi:hypothetical protein